MYPGETGKWQNFGIFRRSRLEDLCGSCRLLQNNDPKLVKPRILTVVLFGGVRMLSRCAAARDGAGSRSMPDVRASMEKDEKA